MTHPCALCGQDSHDQAAIHTDTGTVWLCHPDEGLRCYEQAISTGADLAGFDAFGYEPPERSGGGL